MNAREIEISCIIKNNILIDYVHQAFQLMDQDKDGIIGKNDLRATFDNVGRLVTDKELDDMLNEAPAPINFTQLLNLFASRMSGSGIQYTYIVIYS